MGLFKVFEAEKLVNSWQEDQQRPDQRSATDPPHTTGFHQVLDRDANIFPSAGAGESNTWLNP